MCRQNPYKGGPFACGVDIWGSFSGLNRILGGGSNGIFKFLFLLSSKVAEKTLYTEIEVSRHFPMDFAFDLLVILAFPAISSLFRHFSVGSSDILIKIHLESFAKFKFYKKAYIQIHVYAFLN